MSKTNGGLSRFCEQHEAAATGEGLRVPPGVPNPALAGSYLSIISVIVALPNVLFRDIIP